MGSSELPKLICCPSCSKDISVLADKCPACGAPNSWIHPTISEFLSISNSIATKGRFTFEWNKTEIHGEASRRLAWWQWGLFLFLIFLTVAYLPTFYTAVIWGGAGIWLAIRKKHRFKANVLNSTWESTDEKFWKPVRAALKL